MLFFYCEAGQKMPWIVAVEALLALSLMRGLFSSIGHVGFASQECSSLSIDASS